MTLRNRERQVQEAEERADELLQSAAADIDRQSQTLQQHRQAFEQVCCLTYHRRTPLQHYTPAFAGCVPVLFCRHV